MDMATIAVARTLITGFPSEGSEDLPPTPKCSGGETIFSAQGKGMTGPPHVPSMHASRCPICFTLHAYGSVYPPLTLGMPAALRDVACISSVFPIISQQFEI